MRTVKLTLDEELVQAADRTAKKLGTTRLGVAREALRAALARLKERERERKHREEYLHKPPKRGDTGSVRRSRYGVGRETQRGALPGARRGAVFFQASETAH